MLNNTQKTLSAIIKKALFNSPFTLPNNNEWHTLCRESIAQAVAVLAYDTAKKIVDKEKNAIPRDIDDFWKNSVNSTIRRNIRVEAEHAELHRLMRNNSISYVILKGCASAAYYPDPFLRTLGDVDFLIYPKDAERADKLLCDNGFTYIPSSNTDERVYVRGKSVWELHIAANGTPGGEVGKRIHTLMSDAIDKAKTYNGFLVPSEFHHGLVLLLHTARHMTTGGVGLRQICDWAVFVTHIGARFPEVFETKLQSVGLWRFACILTQLSSEYLGAPTQSWAGKPDRQLLVELMDDIFAGGNFGIKDKSRRNQAKFITDRKSGGAASRTIAGQAIRSADEIVRLHWPFAGKLPILYPVGWLFFGGRYAVRTLTGKRKKFGISHLAKDAKARRGLYERLDLFKK